jgi:hypothetical protein
MISAALLPFHLRESRFSQFFRSAYQGSRQLTLQATVMFLCFCLCMALAFWDVREFNGINVWIKPGKFFVSMVVHFLTTAWALSLLSPDQRKARVVTWSTWVVFITAWAELLYITWRAAEGQASHFNVSTPISAALYSAMALFAVMLVLAPAVIGFIVWRSNRGTVWAESVAIGFGLAAFLSIIVGMTLGGNSGHWIGGDLTDATGLPLFKWSTTGGDLRVSHFVGLHAMQIVPFAAFSGRRDVVWGVAAAITIATALTYIQALSGIPLLRP